MLKKTIVGLALAAGVLVAGADSAETWFAVDFSSYLAGEGLSLKGVTGGAWGELAEGVTATNVFDGVRNGIAIQTSEANEVAFNPTTQSTGEIVRIDFAISAEGLGFDGYDGFTGAAGLAPTVLDDGTHGFCGYTADGWVMLVGADIDPQINDWIDGRIEFRTIGDTRFVSYLVKGSNDWVRLETPVGAQTWFRTNPPADVNGGVAQISFMGNGRFSDMLGIESNGVTTNTFYWIGGADGDWDDPANWSRTRGGTSAGTVPGAAGDVAFVTGTVTLTRGKETATVSNLAVEFDGKDGKIIGGTFTTDIEIDVERPRLGKKIAVKQGTFFGRTSGNYTYKWMRATASSKSYGGAFSCEDSFTPQVSDLENWIKFQAYDGTNLVIQKEFLMSRLPVLYLTTDDGATPTASKEEHTGHLFAQGNDEWKSLYDGAMTIKVRGNSTSSYPKKPWKIKLDKKTKMYDIKKSKHWVLLANYNDQSMLRNKLAYDFANEIGSLGMESTFVECVLNGAWQGTYQFCEHIRIQEDRVDIHDWEGDASDLADAFGAANSLTDDQIDELGTQLEQNFAWVTSDTFTYTDTTNNVTLTGKPSELLTDWSADITGGYLFEFSEEYDEVSKFTSSAGVLGVRTMLKQPEYLKTNTEMFQYCQTFLKDYWTACTSKDGYTSDDKWIGDYCDYESMVNYWLVMELMGNNDGVKKSRYAYKDQGCKLVWGPVWDFDWGMGSARVSATGTGWKCQEASGKTAYSFFKEWTDNPEFCTRLVTRYWQVRDRLGAMLGDDGLIAGYTNLLVEACHANSAKWNIDFNKGAGNFEADVSRLVNYMTARLAWLDQQFVDVPTLMASVQQTSCTAYYTADATTLPIAVSGLTNSGTLYTGKPLTTSFTVGGSSVATISVYVNGVRQIKCQAPVNGVFTAVLPAKSFTATVGEPNCVNFVAYDASGNVVARNYKLVEQVQSRTLIIIR